MKAKREDFEIWDTPFVHGEINIISIEHGFGSYAVPSGSNNIHGLKITIFDSNSEKYYEITNTDPMLAYRVIDELNYGEGWGGMMFESTSWKFSGGYWAEECPVLSHHGLRYLVLSDHYNVEIFTSREPKIREATF